MPQSHRKMQSSKKSVRRTKTQLKQALNPKQQISQNFRNAVVSIKDWKNSVSHSGIHEPLGTPVW